MNSLLFLQNLIALLFTICKMVIVFIRGKLLRQNIVTIEMHSLMRRVRAPKMVTALNMKYA